jgi:hypothetical protein
MKKEFEPVSAGRKKILTKPAEMPAELRRFIQFYANASGK